MYIYIHICMCTCIHIGGQKVLGYKLEEHYHGKPFKFTQDVSSWVCSGCPEREVPCLCECLHMYVHMCIYIYMCVYVYMYTHIYIYIYIYTNNIHAFVGAEQCTFLRGCSGGVPNGRCRVFASAYIHIYINIYIYIFTYIYIYICVYVYMYTHIYIYIHIYTNNIHTFVGAE